MCHWQLITRDIWPDERIFQLVFERTSWAALVECQNIEAACDVSLDCGGLELRLIPKRNAAPLKPRSSLAKYL